MGLTAEFSIYELEGQEDQVRRGHGLFGENNSVNPKAWSMQDSQIIAPQNLFPFCAFFFVN